METRTKNDDWIKLASKSRPGRFYLFNKSTGQTQWIPKSQESNTTDVTASGLKKESLPKFQVSNLRSKTPAQDRLKRLQNNLKVNQIRAQPSKANAAEEKTKNIVLNTKEQRIWSNDLPSTSSLTKRKHKSNSSSPSKLSSPTRVSKRTHSTMNGTPTESDQEKQPKQNIRKTSRLSETLNTSTSSLSNSNFDTSIYSTTKHFQNDDTKSSRLNSLRTGIVNKIKEICKIPFSSTFKKPPNEIAYQRGSANSRLERLRQSLQLQQPSTSATGGDKLSIFESQPISTTSPSPLIFENNNSELREYQRVNRIQDEIEVMDWQSTIKQEPIEISSSDCIVSNNFERPLKRILSNDERTMGDIYDTVNGNLLRFSAEKHKGYLNNSNKWDKEYYYFIVDTNVLLRDLCFIEDLSKMKLCDTTGSMLYIPYCVLQELDLLKMRSGCQEGVKTLAVRAIKYLNSKFENKSNHLQAQSALEERDNLIEINSADDSIINCCLQAKKHVPNLLLLTEDVNLRNKAFCNSILVSTKSDLVSKHYDTNDEKERS